MADVTATPTPTRTTRPPYAVLTVVVLVALWATYAVEQLWWVWGVLFVAWAVLGIRSGETFLIGSLVRARQPLLFWLVCGSWLVMGLLWFAQG